VPKRRRSISGPRISKCSHVTVEMKELSAKQPAAIFEHIALTRVGGSGHRPAVEALPDGRMTRFRAT
jgi:hypothetical protein